jgi:hypothetical protein
MNKFVALLFVLAGLLATAIFAVGRDNGPRPIDTVLSTTAGGQDLQFQTWTWPAPRTPGGHPLAYYRWQVWLVSTDEIYREGTTPHPQATVDFNRMALGGQQVFLRVEWVSTKGRVTPIGDSPHLLIQPLPVDTVPTPPVVTPPDTADNPFGYDSTATVSFDSQWAEHSRVDGRLQVTMTAIGAKVELCKVVWYGTRLAPFPDAVDFTIISPNPPIRDAGPSERGSHCRWFEAIRPVDVGNLGVRIIRDAE